MIKTPKVFRNGWLLLAFSFVTLLLNGCAVNGLSHSEKQAVLEGAKSVVLIRVTSSEKNSPELKRPFNSTAAEIWNLDMPDGKRLPRLHIFPLGSSFSKSAKENGWFYVLLAPGDYFFQFNPTPYWDDEDYNFANGRSVVPRTHDEPATAKTENTNSDSYAFGRREGPAYWLHVPQNKPVVYAGSFNFIERRKKWTEFFALPDKPKFDGVVDESDAAREIENEALPELGPIVSSVAKPYDISEFRFNPGQVNIESSPASSFVTDSVGKTPAFLAAAPLAVPGLLFLDFDDCHYQRSDLSRDLAGLTLLTAAGIVHTAVDATVGRAVRKKWAPHEAALARECNEFEFDKKLVEAVKTLCSTATNSDAEISDPSCSLQITPYRICLRETSMGKRALEVAVRVRLFDSKTGDLIWQNYLVHSDRHAQKPNQNFLSAPFETLVPSSSEARALKTYAEDEGVQLFRKDLEHAVDGLAKEISLRLRQSPE